MNTTQERKKMMRALRSMVLRYRKAGKTDIVAVSSFAYEKGLSRKEVDEFIRL